MKRNLLTILISICFASAHAQITLTQANSAPAVGDVYTYYPCDTMPVPGSSGANITWNMTTAVTATPSSQTIVTPASTGYAASYPNANVAINAGSGVYQFISSSSTSVKQWGVVQGAATTVVYNSPGAVFLTYPYTYATTYTNTNVTGTFTQGTVTQSGTTTYDGYGTLKINGRTYSNVARQKYDMTYDYNYTSIGHLYYHTVSYIWYDGVHKTPLMEIISNDATGLTVSHTKTVIISSYATGIEDVRAGIPGLNVYPNPARDVVHVDFPLSNSADVSFTLYNSIGEIVMTKTADPSAFIRETIDISALRRGIYLLEIIAGNRRETRRVVVE
jgi:hypothetical protein